MPERPKNENVSVGGNLVITSSVERRLMRKAEHGIPLSPLHRLADQADRLAFLLLLGGPIAYWILRPDSGAVAAALLMAGCVGVLCLLPLVGRISDRVRSRRSVLVRARFTALAEDRKRRIDEAQAFYASPEWKLLRDEVIREQGRVCGECGHAINSDLEVTVDHILPRSKYPHLALSKDNLRVLCRSCNSTKGNRQAE